TGSPTPTVTGTPPTATQTPTAPPPLPTATPTNSPTPLPPSPTGTVILPGPIVTQPPILPDPTVTPACGLVWRGVPAANARQGHNLLQGVAAVAPEDIWAVGSARDPGGPPATLTEHWTESGWTLVPSPDQGTGGST